MTAGCSSLHAETQLLNKLKIKKKLGEIKSINISSSPCSMCTCFIIKAFRNQQPKPIINVLRINGEKNKDKWKRSKKNLQTLLQLGFHIGVMERNILVECIQVKGIQEDLKASLLIHKEEVYRRGKEVSDVLLDIYNTVCAHLRMQLNLAQARGKSRQCECTCGHSKVPLGKVVVHLVDSVGHSQSVRFKSQHDFLEKFLTFYQVYKQLEYNNFEVSCIMFNLRPSDECTVDLLGFFGPFEANQRPTIFMSSEFLKEGTNQDTVKHIKTWLAAFFPIKYLPSTSTKPCK